MRDINKDYFLSHPVLFSAPSGNVLINMSALPQRTNNNNYQQQQPQSAYSPNYTPPQAQATYVSPGQYHPNVPIQASAVVMASPIHQQGSQTGRV